MNTAKYIYSLSCPVTGYVKYVGCTSNLKSSLLCHSTGRNIPVRSWISSLNDKPVIEVLDLATEENVLEIESYWIQQMQVWGFCLLNKKSTLSRPYKKLYPRPSKVNIFDQIKEYGLYIKLAKELESL